MTVFKKVIKIFLITLAVFAVVITVLITLLISFVSICATSHSRLFDQSNDWFHYIDDNTTDYINEKGFDVWMSSRHGTSGWFIFESYAVCKIYLWYDYRFQKELADKVVSEIKKNVEAADSIYGGKPSQIEVEFYKKEKHFRITITKPASSAFTFISKKDKELYENAQPSLP